MFLTVEDDLLSVEVDEHSVEVRPGWHSHVIELKVILSSIQLQAYFQSTKQR